MEKLSIKKRKCIIRLYIEGISYNEIARGTNVNKTTVGCVISKLKTGQYPEFTGLSEQIELLRKLVLKLRQLRFAPQQITKEGRWQSANYTNNKSEIADGETNLKTQTNFLGRG